MGSEQSHQRDVDVDTKSVETTAFWTLYNAELQHGDANADGHRAMTEASMFQSEPATGGGGVSMPAPLDRAAKNLMVYRHPSILKFLKSSQRHSQTFLLTERCAPLLPHNLATQSDVQICLGLRSILCALVFLVEHAGARHLNISATSVYLTPAGSWRLAGFEHVWKAAELTASLLQQLQPTRQSADPGELKSGGLNLEQFAFAVLCEQVLQPTTATPTICAATEFLQFCRQQLRHPDAASRPPLSACLQHAYFTHDFVRVHSFLTELPVKSAHDRLAFFTHLPDRLRRFDERTVASQLAELLLSRMVLIDPTAQLALVPLLLGARTAHNPAALFEPGTFRTHIVPRLVQLFAVRETQTRLTLLEYFEAYAGDVPERQLRDRVLPQLLLGIRDSNDGLVAATLRALAVMVPLVGAGTVIGRNRCQIFADGRPQAEAQRRRSGADAEQPVLEADFGAVSADWMEARSITPVLLTAKQMQLQAGTAAHYLLDASESGGGGGGSVVGRSGSGQVMMLERLSPDGGEDEKAEAGSDGAVAAAAAVDGEAAWSDWEADEEGAVAVSAAEAGCAVFEDADAGAEEADTRSEEEAAMLGGKSVQPTPPPQTTTKSKSKADLVPEIDFFADMEPVIEKTNVVLLEAEAAKSRLRIQPSASDALADPTGQAKVDDGGGADGDGGGWGDDLDGWDDN